MVKHKLEWQLAAFLAIMLGSIGLYYTANQGASTASVALVGVITAAMVIAMVVS